MTDAPPTLPPAGWFTDPQNQEQQRWWTGQEWSEHVRPIPIPLPPPPPPPPSATVQPIYAASEHGLPASPWQTIEPTGKKAKRGFLDSPFGRPTGLKNTPGSLSLSFAIVSLASGWYSKGPFILISVAAGIAAIVLAIVGMVRASRTGAHRGTSIAGLIVGIIATFIALGGLVATVDASTFRFDVPALEADIAAGMLDQVDLTVTVDCPGNPPADRGATFTCVARDTDGVNWRIDVTVQDDQGFYVWRVTE